MIRLRISPNDDAVLYKLIKQRLVPFAKAARPFFRYDKKTIFQNLNKSKVFVVASQGRPPIGFISVQTKKRILTIGMLAVDQTRQNKGLGSSLMAKAENYGKHMGCETARLFVDEPNDHALAFYEKRGYETVEYVPGISCYLLTKSL